MFSSLKYFSKGRSSREIIDRIVDLPYHEIDENNMTEIGCSGGACACTGYCRNKRPVTDLDLFENKQYEEKELFVAKKLLLLLVDYINRENKNV